MVNPYKRRRVLTIGTLEVAAAGLILLLARVAALATDGVIQIDQTKANATGGFPYKINQTGSYRLTSNLVVPNANTTAISVNVSDVTIDLNGFSVIGPGIAGSGNGINALHQHLITIYNGEVAGMGSFGILTGHSSRIEHLRLLRNGSDGILCDDGCEISHNVSNNNGSGAFGGGIHVNGSGRISSNVTQFNGVGIAAGDLSVVSGNTANHNTGQGILVGKGSSVVGNAITFNNADGTTAGLSCGSASGYLSNILDSNQGTDVSGCVNLGHNLCSGSLCP